MLYYSIILSNYIAIFNSNILFDLFGVSGYYCANSILLGVKLIVLCH